MFLAMFNEKRKCMEYYGTYEGITIITGGISMARDTPTLRIAWQDNAKRYSENPKKALENKKLLLHDKEFFAYYMPLS